MNAIIKDIIADAQLRHMSAQQIADASGLDRKTVAAILSGETDNPKIETVQAIAHALHGEINYSTIDSRYAVKTGDVSYYRTMIATKEKWLRWLFFSAVALAASNIIVVMICFAIVAS